MIFFRRVAASSDKVLHLTAIPLRSKAAGELFVLGIFIVIMNQNFEIKRTENKIELIGKFGMTEIHPYLCAYLGKLFHPRS